MPQPDRDDQIRSALRRVVEADRKRGEIRPRPDYLRLFPGFDAVVEAELDAVLAAAPPADAPPPAAPMPDAPAAATEHGAHRRIGPYDILRELGRGGMGIVYEASDTRLPRRVALKVLAAQYAASPALRLRLEREASIAARLDHPNLCAVYEADAQGAIPYIAMRLVDGRTLADLILGSREAAKAEARTSGVVRLTKDPGGSAPPSDGRSSSRGVRSDVDRVVALFETVARALHAAHEKGLVHRDVKPANIMVMGTGEPVLLDFGLARDEQGDGHGLTQTGSLMGTPAYMSPEQLMAQRIRLDGRTDVYSLGASLYECVTLRMAFEAPTIEKLYQRILTTDPDDPRRANPAVGDDLAVVIATALEKDRDRRYQSALDLAEDLRRVRAREPINARPAGVVLRLRRWVQRNPAAAAFVAVLVAGLAASSWLLLEANAQKTAKEKALTDAIDAKGRAESSETAARDALRAVQEEKDRTKSALDRARGLALVAASSEASRSDPDLAILTAQAAFEAVRIPETEERLLASLSAVPPHIVLGGVRRGFHAIQWTSEGRILTLGDGTATLWEPDGREVRTLPCTASWLVGSPAADRFAAGDDDGNELWILRGDLAADPVPVDASSLGERVYRYSAAWSPDSRRLCAVGTGGALLIDTDGHTVPLDVRSRSSWENSVAFLGRGEHVVISVKGAGAPRIFGAGGALEATAEGLPGNGTRISRVGGSGRWIESAADFNRLCDEKGAVIAKLPPGPVAVSPAGGAIVVSGPDGCLRFCDADGREESVLALGQRSATQLHWFPSGDLLVAELRTGGFTVFGTHGNEIGYGGGARVTSGTSISAVGDLILRTEDRELAAYDVLGREVNRFATGGWRPVARSSPTAARVLLEDERVWDFADAQPRPLHAPGERVRAELSPRRDVALVRSKSGGRFVDVAGRVIATLPAGTVLDGAAGFSASGDRCAVACLDGRVALFDGRGASVATLPALGEAPVECSFTEDGRSLATAYGDGSLSIWTADSGTHRMHLAPGTANGELLAVSPKGADWIALLIGGSIRILDGAGKTLASFLAVDRDLARCEFDAASGRLLVSPGYRTPLLVDPDGVPAVSFPHDEQVGSAYLLPEGRGLLTLGATGAVRRWTADGRVAATLGTASRDISVSRDRDRVAIVSASTPTLVHVHRLDDSGPVVELAGSSAPVRFVEFIEGDGRIVTQAFDGSIRVWEADGSGGARSSVAFAGAPGFELPPGGGPLLTWTGATLGVWDAAGRRRATIGFPAEILDARQTTDPARVFVRTKDDRAFFATIDPVVLTAESWPHPPRRFTLAEREQLRDLLPDANLREIRIETRLRALHDALKIAADVVLAVPGDPQIADEDRPHALELARDLTDDPDRLFEYARRTSVEPRAPADARALALRCAEIAARTTAGSERQIFLALARYRSGDAKKALATLDGLKPGDFTGWSSDRLAWHLIRALALQAEARDGEARTEIAASRALRERVHGELGSLPDEAEAAVGAVAPAEGGSR